MPMPAPTVRDLEAITKQSYSETSSPTISKVEQLLIVGNAVADGFAHSLGLEGVTEDSPQSYAILKHLAVLYAAAQVTSAPGIDARSEHLLSDYDKLRDEISKRHVELVDGVLNETSWQVCACIAFVGGETAWGLVPYRVQLEAVLRLGVMQSGENAMRSSGVESLLREFKIRNLAVIDPEENCDVLGTRFIASEMRIFGFEGSESE